MDGNTQRIQPYEGTSPYIFISYSHRDYDRVEPILREMAAKGYRFWYDEGIDPGTEWPESIARHLEKSSVCLSFMSANSAASKNCRREINFALSRNIALLTVFLEETQISSGLEMQISTYQSIMGYKYPDLPSLVARLESVDVTAPCRGTGEVPTAAGGSGEHTASAAPRKRRSRFVITAVLAAFALSAVAAAAWLWPKAEIRGEQAETPASTLEPTEEPAEEVIAKATEAPSTQPILTPEPIPEGYSVMLHGMGEDGTVLLCGDGDKTVRVQLTDDRIPDGYPMSEQPGKNNPIWNVVITFGEGRSLLFDIRANQPLSSFKNLHTDRYLTMWKESEDLGGFRYTLTGNTFCFESVLPKDLSTQDIDSINVFLGTEVATTLSEYYFFLDE